MTKHNENNERVKREYFAYLKETQRNGEHSIDAAAMALSRFEAYTRHREFKAFHREQAIAFKRQLVEQPAMRGVGKISKSTVTSTLAALRKFFFWLAGEPGFRSHLRHTDADYFNASDRDLQIAQAGRPPAVPSLELIHHALSRLPAETVLQRKTGHSFRSFFSRQRRLYWIEPTLSLRARSATYSLTDTRNRRLFIDYYV